MASNSWTLPWMAAAIGAVLAGAMMTSSCNPEIYEGCQYHSDCGDNELCEDGECNAVECISSEDCDSGSFCSPRFECIQGCEDNDDCLAGETCTKDNECKAYGCRDTELDCGYGQYCNESTGQCEDDPRDHCGECDIFATGDQCGSSGDCFYFGGEACGSDTDCAEGYECDYVPGYGNICHADICFEQCNPNQEDACPRGFACIDATGFSEYYCYADCTFLNNNGYL